MLRVFPYPLKRYSRIQRKAVYFAIFFRLCAIASVGEPWESSAPSPDEHPLILMDGAAQGNLPHRSFRLQPLHASLDLLWNLCLTPLSIVARKKS
jgi:hypothetical protein